MAVSTTARVYMKGGFDMKRGIKKVTLVRISILLAFFAFLTATALHCSGYAKGFGSGRTVYKVTIATGEISLH